MGNPDNLRAALVAAASMYPEGYGALKQLATFTATQHVQMVFDRAEEMAAWLDAKETGRPATAREVISEVSASRQAARDTNTPVVFASTSESTEYTKWLDANKLRDTPTNQHRYLDTRPGA